jgi:hypothetical protein
MIDEVRYLGDGLYVKFDGYMVSLLANSHEHPTDIVGMEPEVLTAFSSYLAELKVFIEEFNMEQLKALEDLKSFKTLNGVSQ